METLLKNINSSPKKAKMLSWISAACAVAIALFFGMQLILHLLYEQYVTFAIVAVTALIGYVVVGIVRKLVNAPRPYELYDFFENVPKHKPGMSFPSRHAYSAFVLATLAWLVHPLITAALAILAAAICVTRVLVGLHFIRDVIAGALIGVLSGVTGILLACFI